MSNSPSSAPGTDSRSASPQTPSEIQFDVDINTDFGPWYTSDPERLVSAHPSWLDPALLHPQKVEETEEILQLDDLIHGYDDPVSPGSFSQQELSIPQPNFMSSTPFNFLQSSAFTTSQPERSLASSSAPSPVPTSRRLQNEAPRVVLPPKESCYNLAIMFPNSPEGGMKSRVETQIRATLQLADSSSSSDPANYNCVGSWKYLQLPPGTSTKRRTRKQGKVDPLPEDILHLTATVTCASSPDTRVHSCTSCQKREAKRLAKKLAARVRPSRSDSESGDDVNQKPKGKPQEDTTSIIQFNCAEIQDFAKGSVALPLRITCYCRHHREKVGFNIQFTMMDHIGRIVATGLTGPIMITDDHKTPGSKGAELIPSSMEWSQSQPSPEVKAPSKRKKDCVAIASTKKRPKPYDVPKTGRRSREASVIESAPSPSSSYPDTRASTPGLLANVVPPLQQPSSLESDSSADVPATPPDYSMLVEPTEEPFVCQPTAPLPHVLPLSLFATSQPPQSATFPTIHRLIPSCGPTHGGTEVTILGANFHPSLQLDCVFGDVVAGSTHRWSDNTLVCILPPQTTPCVVPVWFNNFTKPDSSNSSTPLFTYSDESDRALMELALQVVGLKMTGKIENAKNIAMRIVGNVANETPSIPSGSVVGAPQMASEFETRVLKLLSVLDTSVDIPSAKRISLEAAISYPSPQGQTLLHLAVFLGLDTLVGFLIARGVDLDLRDRSGCTALHLAAIKGSKSCVERLLREGADVEIVDARGKSPQEVASVGGLFDGLLPDNVVEVADEDEAHWGDAESDDNGARNPPRRIVDRRRRATSDKWRTLTPRSSSSSLTALPDTPSTAKAFEDEKQAANLITLIQRTLAQFPAPQLPNLPGLPPLPEIPAVPWAALPQLPMVFPVFVPWPAFLGGGEPRDGDDEAKDIPRAARAAQELRGTWEAWEKWVALVAGTVRQADEAPPMYTPRETPEQSSPEPVLEDPPPVAISQTTDTPSTSTRHMGYTPSPPVSEQEVNSYTYQPAETHKKHDRMLMFFWLPILLLSLLWAAHNGVRIAFQSIKGALPLKAGFRT
ncbi:hypothetical protein MIND_00057100 [Mycena indigotica]|uniref:IPT/TIG domain-containing protein n=1 Tax=Mycena indigotica TaxID=2126181 RepID=A0A8H6WHT7_9AGAR|nr:uncharacterized protein MIND_00057100 [Mycena indigotica]KAF7315423.1 hypothetical protein MIND_00057100 [Mycena indigotica]